MLSLPLYLQSIHNKEFERNLHTAGSCSSLSECSLGVHSMFSLLFLTVNVHHRQPQHVMDFSLFLLALYLLWDNYLTSDMTTIHVNDTTKKTPSQHQSVHSLGILTTENETLPQWRDFRLRTRCKWDLHYFGLFTQCRLVVSCPMLQDSSLWWWNSHSGVGEDSSHLGRLACRLSNLPSSSGPTVQDEGNFMFNRNVRNPSPVDRA